MEVEKPLYGFDNSSRKFWLRVKDVFLNELKLCTIDRNEAFNYLNTINGAVITHDDFNLAGTPDFIEKVHSVVE